MPSRHGERVDRFYRKSRDWQRCRRYVLARCRGICERCGRNRATEVHHVVEMREEFLDDEALYRRYAVNPDNCLGLCRSCHDAIRNGRVQFDADGEAVMREWRADPDPRRGS